MGVRAIAALGFVMLELAGPSVLAQPNAQKADAAILSLVVWGDMRVDPDAYPEPLRAELSAYVARARAFSSTRTARGASGEEKMVHAAWVRAERRLAASTSRPGAQAEAMEYVDGLRPCYEWEGMSDCPFQEAQFADAYLAKHPGSAFAGLLPLLAAHRWLCAAELFEFEQNTKQANHAQQRFQLTLSQARKSESLVIRSAARQLESRKTCFSEP